MWCIAVGLLALVKNAVAVEPVSYLTQVVVNKTENANETVACLRAEFTAQIQSDGEEFKMLSALNYNNISDDSACGQFTLTGTFFPESDASHSLKMKFTEEERNGKEAWQLVEITYTEDLVSFSNATIENVGAPLVGKYGQSFLCTAGFDVELRAADDTTRILRLSRLQFQPFKVPFDTFANPVICSQDISIVVPAIVGSILGLLVLIVLVTYVIGRRRTRIAYQEI